jgi:hypothetical protein
MLLISHRGNINKINKNLENNPSYIVSALERGYDVEIDVWFLNNKWFLGHDGPQYEVKDSFLINSKFWIHAKNGDAFYKLLQNHTANIFWHTTEDWILTSKGYIWTYPNKKLYPKSICVLPELGYNGDLKKCHGICSDYILEYIDL